MRMNERARTVRNAATVLSCPVLRGRGGGGVVLRIWAQDWACWPDPSPSFRHSWPPTRLRKRLAAFLKCVTVKRVLESQSKAGRFENTLALYF